MALTSEEAIERLRKREEGKLKRRSKSQPKTSEKRKTPRQKILILKSLRMSGRHMVATFLRTSSRRIGLGMMSSGVGITVTASTYHTYQISKTLGCAQNAIIEIKLVGNDFKN